MSIKNIISKDPGLTVFQKKVLMATLKIPEGETRTYKWVAAEAGHPGAARAAGQALGKNPYAPDVPCHRVTASDGSIGGYSGRGGRRGKTALLRKEGIRVP